MKPLRISYLAEADLDEIWLYVAKDRPAVADQLMDRFQEHFILLSENPELGESRKELAIDLRQFTMGSYVVLYHYRDSRVEIVRIVHAARDIPKEYRRRLLGE